MNTENREIRGCIINIIERGKPYGASFLLIEETLSIAGFSCTTNEVKAHLKYLEDKGYVKFEELERGGIKRKLNYITPKGIDLLEGNIPEDPGVMFIA